MSAQACPLVNAEKNVRNEFAGIDDDVKVWGLKPTEEEEEPESLSDLEQTLRVNAHRNTASSFRSRLFVPFLLGARFDSMDF